MLRNIIKLDKDSFVQIYVGCKEAVGKFRNDVSVGISDLRKRMEDPKGSNRELALSHYYSERYIDAILRLKIMVKIWGPSFFTYYNLGRCYFARCKYDKAAEHFCAALEIDPRNELALYYMQKIDHCSSVGCVPPEIAKEYYEYHSNKFLESNDEERVVYADMAGKIKELCPNFVSLDVLDIGCGSGALGVALRSSSIGRLIYGVDIAPTLAKHASVLVHGLRFVYTEVFCAEMHETLAQFHDSLDLIVSYRTLERFGDLSVILELCARALRTGGILMFVAQNARKGDAMHLAPLSDCFLYSDNYINNVVSKTGFNLAHMEHFELQNGDSMVQCILKK